MWECFDDHGDLLQSLVFAAGYAPVDLFSMSLHHGPDPHVIHVTYSSLVVLLFLLPQLLVSRSAKKGVDVWSLRSETSRSFELTLHTVIEGHTDIVRDVVVVAKVPHPPLPPLVLLDSCRTSDSPVFFHFFQ